MGSPHRAVLGEQDSSPGSSPSVDAEAVESLDIHGANNKYRGETIIRPKYLEREKSNTMTVSRLAAVSVGSNTTHHVLCKRSTGQCLMQRAGPRHSMAPHPEKAQEAAKAQGSERLGSLQQVVQLHFFDVNWVVSGGRGCSLFDVFDVDVVRDPL